jgi:hypothetical protein
MTAVEPFAISGNCAAGVVAVVLTSIILSCLESVQALVEQFVHVERMVRRKKGAVSSIGDIAFRNHGATSNESLPSTHSRLSNWNNRWLSVDQKNRTRNHRSAAAASASNEWRLSQTMFHPCSPQLTGEL